MDLSVKQQETNHMAQINLRTLLEASSPIPTDIQALLHIIGDEVVVGAEEYDADYSFPNKSKQYWLNICNDDSYGPVTKVNVLEGHLVLTCNFGDDGDYSFSFTHPERRWETKPVFGDEEEMTINNIDVCDVEVTCNMSVKDIYLDYLLS